MNKTHDHHDAVGANTVTSVLHVGNPRSDWCCAPRSLPCRCRARASSSLSTP